ncbi:flagellar biosynthetic protein FliR [Salinicola rhizosphaerae]|uniref:Flagellar biosynthetic protein FliR n=1 Tax=Salinicola rhizosphaerae TaxID=1443141 RepID=A0ABQ3DN01_9GAMM|nr:flagellar biosynthetic protein FliR [Salinicola rhizosphaerae]GHB08610.1 flagellar biosynthetic protein FliR [Salinicola rhizosphaerae]
MIDITSAQWQSWITLFFWPTVRILAFLMASPLWSTSAVPRQVKLLFGMAIALAIAPTLPPMPDIPLFSLTGLVVMLQQLLIGIAMGMVLRIMIAVVQTAGEFISMQMGLGFATFYQPEAGTNTMVLSRFLEIMTLLMFMAMNGHLISLQILAWTFEVLPVGADSLDTSFAETLVRWGGTIFSSGLLLAIPVVTALLLINLSLGILNRASPQLSIFSVGFPMTLTAGLVLFLALVPNLGGFWSDLFDQQLRFMQGLIEQMAGTPR